jgi:ADP-heptose:LPS heptosyltransferase
MPISYGPEAVRRRGSVLGAMCERAGVDAAAADFRLPVPAEWDAAAKAWLDRWRPDRALLLYRPLNERTEWGGCAARNPDHGAYAELLASVRERFFVVSVADFEPGKEWPVGIDIKPDVECHRGELSFEVMAALARRAALVWSSPGFMVILAQAVGTASVCIFGGYEDGRSFSAGARFAPHLPIEPIKPCACFKHDHSCDKTIDLSAARARLAAFLDAAVG